MFIFGSASEYDLALQFIELSRRYFFNSSELNLPLKKVFLKKGFFFFLTELRLIRSLLSCLCFLAFLWSPLLFFQREQTLALLPPLFLFTESRACCPPPWSTIARVSDWMYGVFSKSLAFLISLLVYFVLKKAYQTSRNYSLLRRNT